MAWTAPQKPAEFTENRLIEAILDGTFPIDSNLPAERELAALLGVTRPTLREALQRLARDGWIEIHHGRATRVRDYWREGNLGVLGAIVQHPDRLPNDFIPNLLFVRELLAPAYTCLAVERDPGAVCAALEHYHELPEDPEAYAAFDWTLHHTLTVASGNPIFTLILNGFQDLYPTMAARYFQGPVARSHSYKFYAELLAASRIPDPREAQIITKVVMNASLKIWRTQVRTASERPLA